MWREPLVLLTLVVVGIVATGIAPADRRAWLLELAPIFVGVPILVRTRRRFPMTALAYRLAFLLSVFLILGGFYTYSQVPWGFWLERSLHLSRNPYDRIVHFVGGFASAILARELVRRKTSLSESWVFTFVALSCLGGAAIYEILEWAAASLIEGTAGAFLATQEDSWDTHWDMLTTFCGAIVSLLVLRARHEHEMRALSLPGANRRDPAQVSPREGA